MGSEQEEQGFTLKELIKKSPSHTVGSERQEYAQAMKKVIEVSIPHGGLGTIEFDGKIYTIKTSPSHTVGSEPLCSE